MRSPSAFERRLVSGFLTLAVVTAASVAAAASVKQECSVAYDRIQSLRADGKLVAASREGMVCARDACPDFIKADCAKWLTEIDAITPTVTFEVRDGAGRETTAVRVELDGKPWLEALDRSAKPIDPGPHTLHYVLATGESFDTTVQIREGEKSRALTAGPAKAMAATPDDAPSRSVAPWVVGGVGLAGLVIGGVLAGVVASDKSKTEDPANCNQAALRCNAAGLSAASQGRTLGPVSTVGFVVGAAGVGAAVVWLVVRGPSKKDAPAAGLWTGPALTAASAAWHLKGSW